jgi:coenzyme F420-0:L-glutamate ligase
MPSLEIIPVPSHKLIEEDDDFFSILEKSLKVSDIELKDDDILVIASKIVAVTEGSTVSFSSVNPTDEAVKLAQDAHMEPEFAQVILDESNYNYTGVVPGAITTINKYGLLANAGADQSNAGEERIILLPRDCKKSAEVIHGYLLDKMKKFVGVIIADSRTTPLRLGTVGCALATFGFLPIHDERGRNDLFGRPMHITVRAIADQLATAAEIVMGETDEMIPFAIIRGFPMIRISKDEEMDLNTLISAEECMFIGPFIRKADK